MGLSVYSFFGGLGGLVPDGTLGLITVLLVFWGFRFTVFWWVWGFRFTVFGGFWDFGCSFLLGFGGFRV